MTNIILPTYLSGDDDQPRALNVTTHRDKVVIQLDRERKEFPLDIQSALEFAQAIFAQAQEILERNKGKDYSLS